MLSRTQNTPSSLDPKEDWLLNINFSCAARKQQNQLSTKTLLECRSANPSSKGTRGCNFESRVLKPQRIVFWKFYNVPELVGFQTMLILDPYGMTFDAVGVFGLDFQLLFKSGSSYCGTSPRMEVSLLVCNFNLTKFANRSRRFQ